MKAISVRAPWWWCILYAGKRIENRGARFSRYTGPVLIHASGWWVDHHVDAQWQAAGEEGWLGPGGWGDPEATENDWTYRKMQDLGSHIVGIADIVAVRPSPCETSVDHDGAHLEPYENPGGLALVLANVRAVETPVPYKGALGLFNVPWDPQPESSTMSTVEEDIKEATKNYASHVITKRGDGRWSLNRVTGNYFRTEVIHGDDGTVFVHGDGPEIAFRTHKRNAEPYSLIRWVADSSLRESGPKVFLGKSNDWDADLARRQLAAHTEETIIEEGLPTKQLEELRELATSPFFPENQHDMGEAMQTAVGSSLDYWVPGIRWSWNLIAARAACKKLIALLDAYA